MSGVVRALPFAGDASELVAALRAGRADASAALYDRHVREIQGLVFRLMGPDVDRDDVVHDVFVRALESIELLRDPSALRSWLCGIAVRTVRIRFQTRRRQRWLRFFAPETLPDAAAIESLGARDEVRAALRDAYELLRGMDAEERIAFVLHRVEGMTLDDAAAAMALSVATYRRRVARGEEKFFQRAKSRPALAMWTDAGNGSTRRDGGEA